MEKQRRCPNCGDYFELGSTTCYSCGFTALGIDINTGKPIDISLWKKGINYDR